MHTIRFQKEDIKEVIAMVKQGSVVAFPTDTVYGLGVIYDNEQALEALKCSKGRPENKPIPTMVATMEQLESIAYMNEDSRKLANAFMPGAFTMILKKREHLPSYLTNGFDTVGVRMPNDAFVLALIEACGKPMLVTSANLSGYETGVMDSQVLAQLDGRIDGIVMGEAGSKIASTIVDMSEGNVNVLRAGDISEAMIAAVLK